MPGIILSLFISLPFYDVDPFMDMGDIIVTCPFLLFHFFVIADCMLPENSHYAILNKVINDRSSRWKELMLRVTSNSVETNEHPKAENVTWYKDRMYLYDTEIDFSVMQQFIIRKFIFFKIKFCVFGLLNGRLKDLTINKYKKGFLVGMTFLQIASLSIILIYNFSPFLFMIIFAIQLLHIYHFFASSKLSQRSTMNDFVHWFQ